MRAQLFAYEVITHQERMQIDTLIGNAQMEQVLDIVRVSLKDNQTTKYKGFLKAMEEDEDILLKKAAEDLGKWIGIRTYITYSSYIRMYIWKIILRPLFDDC